MRLDDMHDQGTRRLLADIEEAGGHTPGPWFITDNNSETRPDAVHSSRCGSIVATTWSIVSDSERVANARLIAAAPELLAALRDCLLLNERGGVGRREFDKWEHRARAAIAKATEGGAE